MQNKDRGVLSARVLMNLEWRRESGPEIKCSRCPATQMMEAGVLLITYIYVFLSNLIFPMNDTFRISDGTTKQQHSESTSGRHTTATATPPHPNPSPGGKKRKRMKMKPIPSIKNADEEEKLLAFSYLFVPLLCLGMKGEKKRERETTKNWLLTCWLWSPWILTVTKTVQEEHLVSGIDTGNSIIGVFRIEESRKKTKCKPVGRKAG